MTLGTGIYPSLLIVWGFPSPETTVLDWCKRLVCSVCGSHDTDMLVPETEQR